MTLPLEGKRIVVTRSKEQARSFSKKIKDLGGIPLEVPLIAFKETASTSREADGFTYVQDFDWVVFTSTNGVRFFFERYKELPAGVRVAAVGPKTSRALERRGIKVDLLPETFVAEGLVEAVQREFSGEERVLLPRGNLARKELPLQLKQMGIEVEELVVYETVIENTSKPLLEDMLLNEKADILTFTSSSTVHHFVQLADDIHWRPLIAGMKVASIGPITENTLRSYQIEPEIIAQKYNIDGLIDAIVDFYSTN
ncbi:uroporphyrinogen-III synthase [Pseudalkalibacillus caeni]|uniref:Uroporphyrinogen-III synthase n=1 Tax=Exobacillus caeni TaxID=2574798 RepID=A0A5R9F6L1_9BACL|nr:uroporphyrinogen-III synthase [Pseudalkalibacillus caeni]TLS39217.1 uroporphyrinogen-III synthase [Pseudalkalibacillus caeni]